MLTTALLPQSAPLEPMHAQYVPVLTDIAPLLLIRELPQDEYPTPALPRPFTSQDVDPVMFGPNITGYLSKSDFSHDTSYTGVFSQTEHGNAWGGGTSGHENTWDSPYFSARAANSTYGSSSVVQPASIRLMLCIKI